jgi:hypothetical protein
MGYGEMMRDEKQQNDLLGRWFQPAKEPKKNLPNNNLLISKFS